MKSNCCNAPLYENTDLCSDCKEHSLGIDEFDEAMDTSNKKVYYNGKLIKDIK